jgi:hypothetical protein
LLANLGASVFDRGERRPITQLKGVSGLLEIRGGKVVQMQAIARREYQMIENAKLRKEGGNGSFVRDVNCLPLCVSTDGCNCFLNSLLTTRGDNDARSLRRCLLGHCQTNP